MLAIAIKKNSIVCNGCIGECGIFKRHSEQQIYFYYSLIQTVCVHASFLPSPRTFL